MASVNGCNGSTKSMRSKGWNGYLHQVVAYNERVAKWWPPRQGFKMYCLVGDNLCKEETSRHHTIQLLWLEPSCPRWQQLSKDWMTTRHWNTSWGRLWYCNRWHWPTKRWQVQRPPLNNKRLKPELIIALCSAYGATSTLNQSILQSMLISIFIELSWHTSLICFQLRELFECDLTLKQTKEATLQVEEWGEPHRIRIKC